MNPSQLRIFLKEHGFSSPTAIIEEMSRLGFLVESPNLPAGRKHQFRTTINGQTRYVYYIKAEKFCEAAEALAA